MLDSDALTTTTTTSSEEGIGMKKGSLVRFVGHRIPLVHGKMYSVHEVKDGWVELWLRKGNRWSKIEVRPDDLELVVE